MSFSLCLSFKSISILHRDVILLPSSCLFPSGAFPIHISSFMQGSLSFSILLPVSSFLNATSSDMFGHLLFRSFLRLCVFVNFNDREVSLSSSSHRRQLPLSIFTSSISLSKFPNKVMLYHIFRSLCNMMFRHLISPGMFQFFTSF